MTAGEIHVTPFQSETPPTTVEFPPVHLDRGIKTQVQFYLSETGIYGVVIINRRAETRVPSLGTRDEITPL